MKTTKSDRAVRGQALWTCQVTLARECRVVEIGSALRTARERLGLGLAEVERETHIRGRYLAALEDERFELLPARDRKSTRLNSSHSQISYAVFCLKKKKKTSPMTPHHSRSPHSRPLTLQHH